MLQNNHSMKNFRILLVTFCILYAGTLFAATGNASDGQWMMLAVIGLLSVIAGILYFAPIAYHHALDLVHRLYRQ
jgi:hypothetical protein